MQSLTEPPPLGSEWQREDKVICTVVKVRFNQARERTEIYLRDPKGVGLHRIIELDNWPGAYTEVSKSENL